MADLKHCEFFLLRYVPDVVKGEFVNLGVVLLEEGENGFTDVRFLRDWRRVRGLDPEADVELLESYEAELRRLLQSRVPEVINYRGGMSRRDWLLAQMQQSFSGAAGNHADDGGADGIATGGDRQARADIPGIFAAHAAATVGTGGDLQRDARCI